MEESISREIKEMENLVMQINYFCHASDDARYATILVKNLAHRFLQYLRIETEDIEHLLQPEKKHHQFKVHTSKHQSDHLHKKIEAEKDSLKKHIQKILEICQQRTEEKITRSEFLEKINHHCSSLLKILESEHHELTVVKKMVAHQNKVVKDLLQKI